MPRDAGRGRGGDPDARAADAGGARAWSGSSPCSACRTGALTNFSVVALVSLYGVTLSVANAALTAFLLATAFGVLAGGFIADATRRHGDVAAAGFAGAAVLVGWSARSIPGRCCWRCAWAPPGSCPA